MNKSEIRFIFLKVSQHFVVRQHFLSPDVTLDSFSRGLISAAVADQFTHITSQAHFHSDPFGEQTEDVCSGCSAPGASLGESDQSQPQADTFDDVV